MGDPDCFELRLEELTPADIPDLLRLSAMVGWDYDEEEVATFFITGRVFGHRDREGGVCSCAAVIPYGESLASIGMVIVHPDYRGRGLGKEVTQACVDAGNEQTADGRPPALMLVATPAGRPVYEGLGFAAVDWVHKYLCDRYQPSAGPHAKGSSKATPPASSLWQVQPLAPEHLEPIIRLDKQAFGADRREFLFRRIVQARKKLVLLGRDGSVAGYGLGVEGPVNLVLGPLVAPDEQAAVLLVEALAHNYPGKLRIDVPSGHEGFRRFLEGAGFTQVTQPPIMVKQADRLPKRNGCLYAIASQAFG